MMTLRLPVADGYITYHDAYIVEDDIVGSISAASMDGRPFPSTLLVFPQS